MLATRHNNRASYEAVLSVYDKERNIIEQRKPKKERKGKGGRERRGGEKARER